MAALPVFPLPAALLPRLAEVAEAADIPIQAAALLVHESARLATPCVVQLPLPVVVANSSGYLEPVCIAGFRITSSHQALHVRCVLAHVLDQFKLDCFDAWLRALLLSRYSRSVLVHQSPRLAATLAVRFPLPAFLAYSSDHLEPVYFVLSWRIGLPRTLHLRSVGFWCMGLCRPPHLKSVLTHAASPLELFHFVIMWLPALHLARHRNNVLLPWR